MSPTTAAATAGIRLNDPTLRRTADAALNRQSASVDSADELLIKPKLSMDKFREQWVDKSREQDRGDEWGREKENSEPQLNREDSDDDNNMKIDDSTTSNSSSSMETDDSQTSNSSSSSDSLALSSSSESSQSNSTAQQEQQYHRESPTESTSAKRLDYSHQEPEESQDDTDDTSECSGGTVIANDFPDPPPNATEEEMNRYYWLVCYGEKAQSMMEERGAVELRSAPAKSWLVDETL
jgi:hypothetical protein